ncbi:MAG: hypothetical protein ACYTFK_11955 [Planctomycetota bacterium]|jgi:hypothetical protein
MSNMPILPVETMVADLHDDDASIIRAAFTSRGVSEGGRLRANKPFRKVTTFEQGCANYVWRMLCFDLVGWGKHACMPVCADFEIMDGYGARDGYPERGDSEGRDKRRQDVRNMMKTLDGLVMQAESVLPGDSMKGVMRWGRALGMC